MSARFYREPQPIGIGSIVIRYSYDGSGIQIGQIVGADESLRSNARWIVFSNGVTSRWHSATILRRLKDWDEAAFVKGAAAAIMAMVPREEYNEPTVVARCRDVLHKISTGELRP